MSIIIKSGASGNLASVDSNLNLLVVTPTTIANTGVVKLAGFDGLALTTSGAFGGAPSTSATKNRLKVGQDFLFIYDPIDGAAINDNVWQRALTTTNYTIAVSGSFLTLNSTNATNANSGAVVFSIKQFQRYTTFPLVARWLMKAPNQTISNGQMEAGFGTYATLSTSAVATITDGAFFRFNTTGLFAVTVFNSTETVSAQLTSPNTNVNSYMIVRKSTGVDFYVNDLLVVTVANPAANPSASSVSKLNWFARAFDNTGSASGAAPRLDIGEVVVFQEDLNAGKAWGDQLACAGRSSIQSPATTWLQTANHANSTSPSSASLSNTAAGYTTLGGRYQFATASGAATDFCLFGYQVPSTYQLVIKQIRITAMNTGAAVATTATILDWSLAVNSSAVSLATADAAPGSGTAQTWSPRRLPLGMQGFIVAAGIGAVANDIVVNFDPPLVCDSGRFVQVILQLPVGTNTASQVIRGDVMINGYFE